MTSPEERREQSVAERRTSETFLVLLVPLLLVLAVTVPAAKWTKRQWHALIVLFVMAYGADLAARRGAHALTRVACALVGKRHAHLREAWAADLYGDPEHGELAPGRGLRLSAGFIVAAIKCRVADTTELTWRPIDRLMASRRASAMAMVTPVAVAVAMIVSRDGIYGLVVNAENLATVGGLPYLAIKTCRRYRQITPTKRTSARGGHASDKQE